MVSGASAQATPAWGRPAGLVTRAMLVAHLSEPHRHRAVLEIMARELPTAGEDTPLEVVADLLQRPDGLPVLIVEEERLVGVVSRETLAELVTGGGRAEVSDAALD